MTDTKSPRPDPAGGEPPDGATAAGTHDAYEAALPVDGFRGTPEEIERQWYEQVYLGRGDRIPQLTVRAVVMGSVLGSILSLTNIYIGLKAGWAFGVAITACILSFAIWTALFKVGIARTRMTILENNCMQSTASSAGYSTGGTLVSAFAAYIMLNAEPLPTHLLMAWVFFLAVLGVTMAIPMKRQMINVEQLRFPTGIAAAETLRALYSSGQRSVRAARALFLSAGAAAASTLWTEGLGVLDRLRWLGVELSRFSLGTWVDKLNLAVLGPAWMGRTVMFAWDPIFIAAGALTGLRVCISMMVGGTLCWAVLVPILQARGLVGVDAPYSEMVQWTLWGGVSCMVTSGLLAFGMQWRSALRAFKSLGSMLSLGRKGKRDDDPLEAIETPGSWFVIGQLVSLVALGYLAHATFGMPYWQSAIAVVLSFALALVACRVTGETDTTPMGAMGKIMQLTFGAISPGNMNVNLMSANITAGAAASSADLLTDLKSGYLLGANPRKQFLAQFAGIFSGTVVTVLAFQVIVPNASVLGSDQFPAPAAQAWKAVAEVLGRGLAELEPIKIWSIAIGGLVGIVLPILARLMPRYQKYLPSPAGLGLSWTFHWFYSLLFFLGAVIGYLFHRTRPDASEEYTFPVASGIIAGGSLMGVTLVFVENGPEILAKLFGG
jgi:OPT family oligopeptide transporter